LPCCVEWLQATATPRLLPPCSIAMSTRNDTAVGYPVLGHPSSRLSSSGTIRPPEIACDGEEFLPACVHSHLIRCIPHSENCQTASPRGFLALHTSLEKPPDTVGEFKSAEMGMPHMPAWKAKTLGNLTQESVLLEPCSRFANSIPPIFEPSLCVTSVCNYLYINHL
jgi:hypothetical protein